MFGEEVLAPVHPKGVVVLILIKLCVYGAHFVCRAWTGLGLLVPAKGNCNPTADTDVVYDCAFNLVEEPHVVGCP